MPSYRKEFYWMNCKDPLHFNGDDIILKKRKADEK